MIVGVLGTLLTLVAFGISVLTLWSARDTALVHAHETSRNVAAVLVNDIARTMDSSNQSLQMLIAALARAGIRAMDPTTRHEVLFNGTAAARYVTGMGVTDDRGQLIDGCCSSTHKWDFSDRDYFRIHRAARDVGLYVSAAYRARSRGGVEAIALSRRIDRDDGAFAGVAVLAIDVDYFRQLLAQLDVGRSGVTAIVRTDGSVIARNPSSAVVPASNLRQSPTFPRMVNEPSGFYEARSPIDGVVRLYTYRRVPGTPFIAVVAPAKEEALASWARLCWGVGSASFAISVAFCTVVWLLSFALRDRVRAQDHLMELTQTDSLTGLRNRRALSTALESEWARLQRDDGYLSVIFVDADNFKDYNDRFGHATGDDALRLLASHLLRHARQHNGLAARYGGEEFVVVLPDTGASDGLRIAEAIRHDVEHHRASALPPFTVSIGGATTRGSSSGSIDNLTRSADDALYQAKREGRNRVIWRSVRCEDACIADMKSAA
ncbi:sensor domain-containing diguanylate cyclase [Cupriavidus plantarum]|nr:hypothetical protein LMG26296_02853 [Cupriavidus plantarum]SMR85740.1 diguanylate cyclase (GGDEF) domain-containing protein [Cupriavidus plantarum]